MQLSCSGVGGEAGMLLLVSGLHQLLQPQSLPLLIHLLNGEVVSAALLFVCGVCSRSLAAPAAC